MQQPLKQELKDNQGVYLKIEINPENDWIYLDWIGYQDEKRTKEGMSKYLELMKSHRIKKILSDNRNQHGPYPAGIDQWIGSEWLPEAIRIGFKAGATVLSPKVFSKLSANNLVQNVGGVTYKNFEKMDEAVNWLKQQ